jgi:hypothetical protein
MTLGEIMNPQVQPKETSTTKKTTSVGRHSIGKIQIFNQSSQIGLLEVRSESHRGGSMPQRQLR